MAIKNRPPGLRYILLLLLFIFGTQVYSQEFSQDLGGYDGQAVNGSHLSGTRFMNSPSVRTTRRTVAAAVLAGTKRGSQPALHKRQIPIPVDGEPLYAIYTAARTKGNNRRFALVCGNQYNPSVFASYDDAPMDNGWMANKRIGTPQNPATVQGSHKGLEQDVVTVMQALDHSGPGDITASKQANLYYEWQHRNHGTTFNTYPGLPLRNDYGATDALYGNQMNPKGGMIMCLQNYGPDYEIQLGAQRNPPAVVGPAPPMKQLSDILFFQWKKACSEKGMMNLGSETLLTLGPVSTSDLRWIFQRRIADPTSMQVIDAVTAFPNEGLIAWPGRDYNFDPFTPDLRPGESSYAHALLGTPQGASVAFLLLQYERQIGRRVPTKVQVWAGSNYPNDPKDRNMLFWISPRPDQDTVF
ncbi:hypothetical protein LTR56_010516 [Elasticomyces elasticus]|nr:hypothetical protein LTR56_010516 [Elasticomyces elasticus]KAK3657932.1 hypothetical protein LTR22_009159 [Elasticomyces elasticus]KAK4917619.1 hypothetical protein LTR49_014573 [Elasticomyces elasticus]KAK5762839.1 hypothetical protein LTS12_007028 [Elasticomyces elasticus]